MIVLIDNYDSFTWNVRDCLVKAIQQLSNSPSQTWSAKQVLVVRNDQISVDRLLEMPDISHIVISPGPGHPNQAGISMDVIRHFQGKVPILGICLGMQAICAVYGGSIDRVGQIVHGKTSLIEHDQGGFMASLAINRTEESMNSNGRLTMEVTRYHSLCCNVSLNDDADQQIKVCSKTVVEGNLDRMINGGGVVMGLRHVKYAIEGVQYHPESVASSPECQNLFVVFLSHKSPYWIQQTAAMDIVNQMPLSAMKLNKNGNLGGVESMLVAIGAKRYAAVQQQKMLRGQSIGDLQIYINKVSPPAVSSLYDRLQWCADRQQVCLIAEFKRRSPSKGLLAGKGVSDGNAVVVAMDYVDAGADAISVLTESDHFDGRTSDLRLVRQALEYKKLQQQDKPQQGVLVSASVLCKDFIVDEYQILEARLNGADSVLLIVALLTFEQLKHFINISRLHGMEPLVEVANEDEMRLALQAGSLIVGVNNRNLHDFSIDKDRAVSLSGMVQSYNNEKNKRQPILSYGLTQRKVFLLALSGIKNRTDVERYFMEGAAGVLVGESVMTAFNRQHAVSNLKYGPLVKFCGLTKVEDAVQCCKSSAAFVGVIFVKTSKRCVDLRLGSAISSAVHQQQKYQYNLSKSECQNQSFLSVRKMVQGQTVVIGVFQDQPQEFVNKAVAECQLDMVQLHGNESPEYMTGIDAPVIKVIGVTKDSTTDSILQQIKSASTKLILLDTKTDKESGGTGQRFNWQLAKDIANMGISFMIAGGISVSNCGEAFSQSGAVGIDVSSGVEISKEDIAKDYNSMALLSEKIKTLNL